MTGKDLLSKLESGKADEILAKLYGYGNVNMQKKRYASLISGLLDASAGCFPAADFPETAGDLRVFSAPGRTELGGNHTDHNRGKILAASIQMDAVAVAAPRSDKKVFFRSTGHPDVRVDLGGLSPQKTETGKTEALVRGIAAEFAARGTPPGGFTANANSTVLAGSGLSSSAAIEMLFCKIFDCLYGQGERSALELAQIGQKAENVYFGKPCGLMDQLASASGGVVAVDFADTENPGITQIDFDIASSNVALCVVDTKGSHVDLTPDYAAVPEEMKAAASFFGKTVLREVDEKTFKAEIPALRKAVGDRAVLRALHFFNENRRVDAMLTSLELLKVDVNSKTAALGAYLDAVNKSGDSSWELLQNIYSPQNPHEQSLSLALALTKDFFAKCEVNSNGAVDCACRVHGGGFAGTIQVYLNSKYLDSYRKEIELYFGSGSLTELCIRPVGAVEISF